MNLSQQTKPYPRTMYHRDHDKPKVVNSKAEEAEASTKGWIVSYIYKEYPKYVGDKIVYSKEEEERLFVGQQKELVNISAEEVGSMEDVVGASLFENPEVIKETQVDMQDTAVVEKPKRGRPKK